MTKICFLINDIFSRKYLILLPIILLLLSFSLHTIDSIGQIKEIIITNPSPFKPEIPNSYIYTTESGLNIFVPYANKKCDDCDLPCTETPKPNLRLVEKGKIESGFILE